MNVLLDLRLDGPLPQSMLEEHAEATIEAVEQHAAHIALGPVLALNLDDCAIRLRFDVQATGPSELYARLSELLAILEQRTTAPIAFANVTVSLVQ